MQSAAMVVTLLLCLGIFQSTYGARFQDDRNVEPNPYIDAGSRDLGGWILDLVQHNERVHKRNSEIINSLLGLPKVLNDAGR